MDFNTLSSMFQPLVLLGCLGVGYIIKHSFDKIPNKHIPSIVGVLGVVLNITMFGFTMENAIFGLIMGLASTGMHQAFKQFIEGSKESE